MADKDPKTEPKKERTKEDQERDTQANVEIIRKAGRER